MAIAVEHSGLHNRSGLDYCWLIEQSLISRNILQDCLEDYNDGGNQPGQTDARVHDHDNVPLNVDCMKIFTFLEIIIFN